MMADQPRGPWFKRTLLFPVTPTGWKGIAVIAAALTIGVGGSTALDMLGYQGWSWLWFLAALTGFYVVAELHMALRRRRN